MTWYPPGELAILNIHVAPGREGESSELSKRVALICICIISRKRNKVIFYQTFYLRKKV